MLFSKKPSFDESLKLIQAEQKYLNTIIGGWPTQIRNEAEGQAVKKRWNSAVNEARVLLKQRSDSIDAKFALADLLRMGHNIDVEGAAQASHTLLQEIIQTNPDHFGAHYSLAGMYVGMDAKAAPIAERLFLKAEMLAAPDVIPGIYQGLGFACLYQQKVSDAIAYFEKYLQLQNDPKIRQLLYELKSGKDFKIVS